MKIKRSLQKEIPILLTSSVIAHDTQVKLLDPSLRLQHTIESIQKWIEITPESPIVVCDGSGYNYSELLNEKFPGHPIEFLYFNNDQALVKEFGRGYGEGEIVKFAIENSKKIKEHKCFAKCTAKLWVKNYFDCIKFWEKNFLCKAVFQSTLSPFKKPTIHYIDTRFYISDLQFYRDNFIDCHKTMNSKIGDGLEKSFLKEILTKKINNTFFPIYPIICGIGGGTAKTYKTSRVRILKEKLKLITLLKNKNFNNLFKA